MKKLKIKSNNVSSKKIEVKTHLYNGKAKEVKSTSEDSLRYYGITVIPASRFTKHDDKTAVELVNFVRYGTYDVTA